MRSLIGLGKLILALPLSTIDLDKLFLVSL